VRTVVRNLQDLRAQVYLTPPVRLRQFRLGLLIETTGEQEPKSPVAHPQHHRVAVYGVRGGHAGKPVTFCLGVQQGVVPHARAFRRLAQELQARCAVRQVGRYRAEDLDLDALIGQEREGLLAVPLLETQELDRGARVIGLQRPLPPDEGAFISESSTASRSVSSPVITVVSPSVAVDPRLCASLVSEGRLTRALW
jgi:hypothetical protein